MIGQGPNKRRSKFLKLVAMFLFCSSAIVGQWNPVEEYNQHNFPCDSGQTTIEITFCAGDRNAFADSLLNKLYKKILFSADHDISEAKNDLAKLASKKIKTAADSTAIV